MVPNYLHLILFQGLIQKEYNTCLNLLYPLVSYSEYLTTTSDFQSLFLSFLKYMDSDNSILELHIILTLNEIMKHNHNTIIDPITNTRAVVVAARYGHYNTVACLLETCDITSYKILFEHIHEFEESIIMMILRVVTPIIIPDITTIVYNCITNNNRPALDLLEEWFPTKYKALTGCEDCQNIIQHMNTERSKQYNTVPTTFMFSGVRGKQNIEKRLYIANKQLIDYLLLSEKRNVHSFVPSNNISVLELLYSSIHQWWSYLAQQIHHP